MTAPTDEYIDDDWTPEGEDDLATIEANLEAIEKGLVTNDPFGTLKAIRDGSSTDPFDTLK